MKVVIAGGTGQIGQILIDGCDVLINLVGRSVNCRYSPENLKEMMRSMVELKMVSSAAVNKARPHPRTLKTDFTGAPLKDWFLAYGLRRLSPTMSEKASWHAYCKANPMWKFRGP